MTTAPTITRPMTADELLAMPDDGFRYELVRGELNPVSGLPFQVADDIFCNAYSLDLQKTLLSFSLQYLNVDSRAFRRVRKQLLNNNNVLIFWHSQCLPL